MIINTIPSLIKRLVKLSPGLIIFLGCTFANAQQVDSLSSYIQAAALNNPGLKAKYLQYQAALEKVPQAGTLPDPELQFGFFINKMELMEGYQLADFRLMQMTPWFGTLKAAKDEASKMALARFHEVESLKDEIFLKVKTSWYRMFKITSEIKSTQKNLDLLKALERLARIRFKTDGNSSSGNTSDMTSAIEPEQKSGANAMGSGSMGISTSGSSSGSVPMPKSPGAAMGGASQNSLVNLLRVQMEIGELENRKHSLEDQLITEKTRFNSFLGRKPGAEVFISDSLQKAKLPGSLIVLADSVTNNPMVKMFEADKQANEARLNMATKMGYPMIGIGLNYSLIQKFPDVTSMMNGKDMIMPMVTATLPIYRKKYRSLRQEAGYLRDAAAESATNMKNELKVSYQEAIQLYNDAERRVELFSRQASLAEKAIALLTRSFSVAGTDFEEILRMQQQLLDYEFKQVEALVDGNTAVATLRSIISYN